MPIRARLNITVICGTSWWCAGWGGEDHSRAAPQQQPLLPVLADRTPRLAAGTSVVVQKPATKKGKICLYWVIPVVFTFISSILLQLPDRTALAGTGPSCLASGCPYCFAGCRWQWGWGLAACLQWSGSWILGLAPQLGGLSKMRRATQRKRKFVFIIHRAVQCLEDFKLESSLHTEEKQLIEEL